MREDSSACARARVLFVPLFLAGLGGCDTAPSPGEERREHSLVQSGELRSASPIVAPKVKSAPPRVLDLQLGQSNPVPMRVAQSSPEEGVRSKEGEALVPLLAPSEQKNVKETLAGARRYGLSLYEHGSQMDCQVISDQAPSDAWGSRLVAQCPAGEAVVELTSFGPDKHLATQDDIVWRQPVVEESDISQRQ